MSLAFASACTPDAAATSGAAHIAFTLPDGAQISSITYQVTSSAHGTVASGSVATADPNTTPSFDLLLPADPADVVHLTAQTGTGAPCSGSSAPFAVQSDLPVTVPVALVCGGGASAAAPGVLSVSATVTSPDGCPTISSSVVAPAVTSVGSSIMVHFIGAASGSVHDTGTMQLRLHAAGNSSTFDVAQGRDYSFQTCLPGEGPPVLVPAPTITGYIDGTLAYGVEPK